MIHQYKLNGYNIVIDVYSGAVHQVDDVAYDIIRLFCEGKDLESSELHERITGEILSKASCGEYGEEEQSLAMDETSYREEIGCCIRDVLELAKKGKLFTEDEFRVNADALKTRHSSIKALCLHVSHACDLTCSYCFAGQGRFNGPAALMSLDVAKRAIDFLVENSGERRNLEVDFFGGEPLLNFDVVKETVKYARSIEKSAGKNFRFTLTTNGMGITDEVIDFCNRECHNVVLSLDGRKEIHDRERRAAGSLVDGVPVERGRGSYDIVVPKFQRMVASRTGKDCSSVKASDISGGVTLGTETGNTNYYMRGTFTHYNPDFTEDIFHMTELGFDELSMEPVVTEPESPFALTEEDIDVLFDQYEKLACEMLRREKNYVEKKKVDSGYEPKPGEQPFNFYHYLLDLDHGPCIYKRISGCGSGTEYFAVTPQGELYPCHQFVGEPEYLMGNIWDGITDERKEQDRSGEDRRSGVDIRDEFKMCNVYARTECDDCWARLYCSGGCAANAYHATGSILGVYDYGCRLFKKRIECALMMQVAKAEEDVE